MITDLVNRDYLEKYVVYARLFGFIKAKENIYEHWWIFVSLIFFIFTAKVALEKRTKLSKVPETKINTGVKIMVRDFSCAQLRD